MRANKGMATMTIGLLIVAIIVIAGIGIGVYYATLPGPTVTTTTTTTTAATTTTTTAPTTTTTTTTTAPPGPVKYLTWWAAMSEIPRQQVYQSAMDNYSIENPDVHLEFHHVDDLASKLELTVPAGVGPDFIRWAHDKIGEFVTLDLLVPLEDYISPEFRAKIPDSVWEAVTLNGHIYGIPETAESLALLYNKDMVSNPPTTMDEMTSIMAEYYNPTDSYGLSYPGLSVYQVAAFVHAFGGYYYDDTTDSVGLDSPGFIQALHYILDNITPYMLDDLDYGVQAALFTEGKTPLSINGPWYFSVADEAGLNWGIAKLPTISGVGPLKPFMGVQAYMITKNCDDVEATVKYLEWITSPPVAVNLSMVTGTLPVNTDSQADPRIAQDPIKSVLAKQIIDAVAMSKKPEMGPIWNRGYEAINAILAGTKTVEDGLTEAQQLVEQDIEAMHGG